MYRYIYAALQICGHLTNRMRSNNCLVRLAVCYACLLAGFHNVGFTIPYIPPVRIEFACTLHYAWLLANCLSRLLPRLQLLAIAICLCVLFVSPCYKLCVLYSVAGHCMCSCLVHFLVSISKVKFQRISSQFQHFQNFKCK